MSNSNPVKKPSIFDYFAASDDLSGIIERCSDIELIKQMDAQIRKDITKILRSTRECLSEPDFEEFLIQNWARVPVFRSYRFFVGRQYDIVEGQTNHGNGDLILTDGSGHYLVVEIKFIPYRDDRNGVTMNRKKRRKVEEQALKYADCLSAYVSCDYIRYVSITNRNWKWITAESL